MWSGWSSQVTEDPLPPQRVCYMTKIGKQETSNDSVLEIMKRSISVVAECRDDCISVTYDLAIAKPATQIQSIQCS